MYTMMNILQLRDAPTQVTFNRTLVVRRSLFNKLKKRVGQRFIHSTALSLGFETIESGFLQLRPKGPAQPQRDVGILGRVIGQATEAASSSANPWAVCGTRQRFGGTAEPTLARCPAG
jgi:hypothetical protein